MENTVYLFDTTLRDGQQTTGVNFSVSDKMAIAEALDDLGLDYLVTIVEAGPCEITQIKSINNEGYSSIQMGYLEKEARHTNKPEKGHFAKAGASAKQILKEFTFDELENVELGQKVTADIFETGDFECVCLIAHFGFSMTRRGFSNIHTRLFF